MKDFRLPLDDRLFHGLNGLAIDWLDWLWVFVSERAFGITCGVLILCWVTFALGRKSVRPVLQVVASIAITDQLGALMKHWVGRLRPPYALDPAALRQLSPIGHTGSMPSLHAANSFAFAFALGFCVPGTFRYTLPLATLIALSRVGVGVHWPSDILAGALWGTLVGLAVNKAGALITKQPPEPLRASVTPVTPATTRPERPG